MDSLELVKSIHCGTDGKSVSIGEGREKLVNIIIKNHPDRSWDEIDTLFNRFTSYDYHNSDKPWLVCLADAYDIFKELNFDDIVALYTVKAL